MDAVIVDLKDFVVRTPEQVVRVFFRLYGHKAVKAGLWDLFIAVAGIPEGVAGFDETSVAKLVDHLVALVEAVEKLRAGDTAAQVCVVCGSKRAKGFREDG